LIFNRKFDKRAYITYQIQLRYFVILSLVLISSIGETSAVAGTAKGSQPVEVGYKTQLFVDDYIIHNRYGLERKAQPCTKMDKPVLAPSPDAPWEYDMKGTTPMGRGRVFIYGTVFYDPSMELYRMWYMARMSDAHDCSIPELELPGENIHGDLTAYATSKDGINWTRPNLGLVHFNGNPNNNIMLDFHGATVFYDPQDPDPSKRYKAVGFIRRFHEIRVAYSSDGIHWSQPVHATDRYNEGAFNGCYVPYLDCYIAGSLERSTDPLYSFTNHRGDVRGKRVALGLATGSKDLNDWVSRTVINPDYKDHPNTQFSRDGREWHRLEDRQPIIPLGPKGSFDSGMIMMTANGAFLHNDELIAYYSASTNTHGNSKNEYYTIARASWPLDRLVAMEAGEDEAILETKLLVVPKGKLIINADARGGYVTAEVLDAKGQVQPGFSSEKCLFMVNDSLRYNLKWQGKDLSQASKPMQLRFKVKNAKLFSFRFAKDD